jgi:hypothetical protein
MVAVEAVVAHPNSRLFISLCSQASETRAINIAQSYMGRLYRPNGAAGQVLARGAKDRRSGLSGLKADTLTSSQTYQT